MGSASGAAVLVEGLAVDEEVGGGGGWLGWLGLVLALARSGSAA